MYHVLITPVKWADDAARHIAENVGQQMEDKANDDAVYPTGQLRQIKARAMAAMGRQPESYDVSNPRELTEFSYKVSENAGKLPGHSEV